MENNSDKPPPAADAPKDTDDKMVSDSPLPKKPDGDAICLERRIGLFSATMVILGNIIGSGIFLTPTGVYNNVGQSVGMSMMVWSVCGVFSTIGALCFAELGTTIESSGAEYSYIKECFGNVSAFLVLWANLIIIVPTGQMIVALTCAYYIVEPLYPDPDCPPPQIFVQLIAVLVVGDPVGGPAGAAEDVVKPEEDKTNASQGEDAAALVSDEGPENDDSLDLQGSEVQKEEPVEGDKRPSLKTDPQEGSPDKEITEDHSAEQGKPSASQGKQGTASDQSSVPKSEIVQNDKATENDCKPSNDGDKRVKETPNNNKSSPTADLVALKREIGLFSGVTIILGNIIGSGIFITPTSVYNNAGSFGLSMIVWIVSGIFSLIGALCFAELGTTIDSSGAEYSYIRDSFGDLAAFVVLWVNLIIIIPTGHMIVALTFAFYLVEPFFPDPDCPPPDLFVRIVAVLVQEYSPEYRKVQEGSTPP